MMGFHLTGDSNWDGVEVHLRIFGHLPEEGCYRYYCLNILGWEESNKKLEEFFEKLATPIKTNKVISPKG